MMRFISRRNERRFGGYDIPPLIASEAGKFIRIWPLTVLVAVGLITLGLRLFQLTVVEGEWRRRLAEANRILVLPVAANRGILTDRYGERLTNNVPLYRRQKAGTSPAAMAFEAIDREQALALLANPEERVSYSARREYPCGEVCASFVGYVGQASAEDVSGVSDYVMGDMMGRMGAERAYERQLRGVPGEEYIEVNALGLVVRTVGMKESQPGTTIALSLDVGLQQVLHEAMEEMAGAAVVLHPGTGEVLALVSTPTFDPNDVSGSLSRPDQPFFNRALAGTYPPGSTFKMVTAAAALEEGKITGATTFDDTGALMVGQYRFGNWLFLEHGRTEAAPMDVVRALARSNDIFFYHIGGMVGPDALATWARAFGYGSNWNLSGWGARSGLVPDPAWKLAAKKERWYLGNTYHMSIGQGDVLATPLQVAVMTAALARGGVICPPRFDRVEEQDDVRCQQLNLSPTTVSLIQTGMKQTCQPGGTGSPLFGFTPAVGCKTGTSEQGGGKMPHAWFTVYAPAENPQIVVTVLVEAGGQGSQVAGPIAKKALEYWFQSRD